MSEEKVIRQSHLNKSRDDKFLLVFDIPVILKQKNSKIHRSNKFVNMDSVQFSVFGTAVPEIVVPAVENRYAGNTLYVSSHSKNSYDPVTLGFKIDNQYNNYWVIYQWLNLLHDEYEGRYNVDELEVDENFRDYQVDLTVYGLDENNEKRIKFTYKDAFPTAIEGITYDYKNGDEITSGFRFVYSQLHTDIL